MVILGIIIAFIFLLIVCVPAKKERDHKYNAEFGNPRDYFSRRFTGFTIGDYIIDESVCFSQGIVIGPSGSGKGSKVLTPTALSLIQGGASFIVNDIGGAQIYKTLSGYATHYGYEVVQYDFTDSAKSACFNPLLDVKTPSDAKRIAQVIYQNGAGDNAVGDKFWSQNAIMLLGLLITYICFYEPIKKRTLQNVLLLLETFSANPELTDRCFVACQSEDLLLQYRGFVCMPEKTLGSVIASTRICLELFTDIEICKTTASNSIEFSELRKKKFAIFVSTPLKSVNYTKAIVSLLFESFFNAVLTDLPTPKDKSVFALIDEAGIYKLPHFSTTVSQARRFRCGILIAVQSIDGLLTIYSPAETNQIVSNCSIRIFLQPLPLPACIELSKMSGKYTYESKTGEKVRELLTPEEIRQLKEALVFVGSSSPLLLDAVPYFKNPKYRFLKNFPPLQTEPQIKPIPPRIEFNREAR